MNPPVILDFQECDTCRARPGSPSLCAGCLNNRRVISQLKEALRYHVARAARDPIRAFLATPVRIIPHRPAHYLEPAGENNTHGAN